MAKESVELFRAPKTRTSKEQEALDRGRIDLKNRAYELDERRQKKHIGDYHIVMELREQRAVQN